MRWLFAALAALLVAAPASANVTKKIAVLYQTQNAGGFGISTVRQLPFEYLLNRMGIAYDRYDVSTRSWNTDHAVDDSVWFRQRYEAVIIPRLPRTNNPGMDWHENFENSSSVDGWNHGPLNGMWSIPVYIMAGDGVIPEAWYNHGILTGDSLRIGVINVGSRALPTAAESLGTWRDRSRSRIRGDAFTTDTLYARPGHIVQKSPLFHETVAAITWMDTTNAAVNADTLMTTWRYRPLSTKPGIVWTIFAGSVTATATDLMGPLILFELMFRETEIKPLRKLPLAFVWHDFIRRAPNSTTDAMVTQMIDATEAAGIRPHWAMDFEPCMWGSFGHASLAWPRLRRHFQEGSGDWSIHSHSINSCGGGNWTWNSTDSANVRLLYNRMLAAAARPDSFNIRYGYNPYRTVPANSDMPANAVATAYRAGVRVVETGDYAQTVANDGLVASRRGDSKFYTPPNTNYVLNISPTFGMDIFQKNLATAVAVNGSGVLSLSIRQYVSATLGEALITQGSANLHFYTIAGNTDADPQSDPYAAWIIEKVLGTWLGTFSNIVQQDVPVHPTQNVPNRTFTPRP